MNQAAEVIKEVEVKESRKSTFMQRVWSKMGKDEKGFTLIELLAVLVIIAIIAVIAIPLISNIINNSKKDSDLSTARQIYDASKLYVTSELNGDFKTTGNLTIKVSDLQGKGFLETPLYLPSSKQEIEGTSTVNYVNGVLKAAGAVVLTDGDGGAGATEATYTAEEVLKTDRAE